MKNNKHNKLIIVNKQDKVLGYKTKDLEVSCLKSTQTINIILEEQLYKIPEVKILASGEDPAYSIRKSLNLRKS